MDKLLKDLVPYKTRLWLYLIAGMLSLGLAAWQAADGNWLVFMASIFSTVMNALAAANVDMGQEV